MTGAVRKADTPDACVNERPRNLPGAWRKIPDSSGPDTPQERVARWYWRKVQSPGCRDDYFELADVWSNPCPSPLGCSGVGAAPCDGRPEAVRVAREALYVARLALEAAKRAEGRAPKQEKEDPRLSWPTHMVVKDKFG